MEAFSSVSSLAAYGIIVAWMVGAMACWMATRMALRSRGTGARSGGGRG